jgi:hypothetical protein
LFRKLELEQAVEEEHERQQEVEVQAESLTKVKQGIAYHLVRRHNRHLAKLD